MNWWKRLKGWQKAGIILGSVHMVFYVILLILAASYAPHGESGLGYLLFFLEWPWMVILGTFHLSIDLIIPVTYTGMLITGIIGSFFYALVAMAVGWFLFRIRQRPGYDS